MTEEASRTAMLTAPHSPFSQHPLSLSLPDQ